MNKRFLLSIMAMLFVAFGIMAQSRSASEALSVANSFLSERGGVSLRSSDQLSLVYTSKSQLRGTASQAYFYVFNRGENNGFVIVSGDERAKDILGYAEAGSFNLNNLPANMRSWLTLYEAEIESLNSSVSSSSQAAPVQKSQAVTTTAIKPSVAPLVQTLWGQGDPYDIYTPVIANGPKTPTGCVATAIAQLMRYHNYPAKGRGSHSYTSNTFKFNLSADFNTTYDWANMPLTYDDKSTAAQREAVAKLMYHVGVAFDMDYDDPASGGSGTIDDYLPPAMVKYFDYDQSIMLLQRGRYSYANWTEILKNELSEDRPVYYTGVTGVGGGHAFVCDGYDTNDRFHINWGWDGSSDGYFELSALNPASHGTGGSVGGFNFEQSMIINIKPNEGGTMLSTIAYTSISSDKTALASMNESFKVSISNMYYVGYEEATVSVGIALCKTDGTILKYVEALAGKLDAYQNFVIESEEVTFPGVAAGSYIIQPAYVDIDAPDVTNLLTADDIGIPILELTVNANGSATIKQATFVKPILTRNSFALTGDLFPNQTANFKANLTNGGDADYRAKLKVTFQGEEFFLEEYVVIPAGATKDVNFSGIIDLAPGTYAASLVYDKNDSIVHGSSDYAALGAAIQVTVGPLPSLVVVSEPAFPNKEAVDKGAPKLKAKIGNEGGRFVGVAVALIMPLSDDEILAELAQELTLEKDEVKDLEFNSPINLEPGNYILRFGIAVNGAFLNLVEPFAFTLTAASATDKVSVESPSVAFDASFSQLQINSGSTVRSVNIYSITGKLVASINPNAATVSIPVGNLASGAYISRVVTDKGISTFKLYKMR